MINIQIIYNGKIINNFKKRYFYKTDLQSICRKYQLPTSGTKAELNTYIIRLINGESAKKHSAIEKE
ncbi:SAP domain-containing protein [Apilactobacillus apisilvae]|uniref:SAP domain-containing protein n=1 Tax=Apilactobacillus apisilvae TaxID=2923364 RepID=A0ABY4PG84_9LACO|nr:SAP domain-containing protein [Apilactobacillus apisilvae]UQS84570.1 SAP domain-containing protein [Apilactobacillus apisilvae]